MSGEGEWRAKARYLKALAHPTRLRIIELLGQGEHCVSSLEILLALKQANVSQHLSVLSGAGIVEPRRDGMKVCYRLVDERPLRILELIERVPLERR
ncbi:MAG: metalloregulator ArsR/SmtB family transcription factor [Bacillota bacterium]|nr:metalloregulator ArsR/SmtB family transcription factor [Bacillota bacterium]